MCERYIKATVGDVVSLATYLEGATIRAVPTPTGGWGVFIDFSDEYEEPAPTPDKAIKMLCEQVSFMLNHLAGHTEAHQ